MSKPSECQEIACSWIRRGSSGCSSTSTDSSAMPVPSCGMSWCARSTSSCARTVILSYRRVAGSSHAGGSVCPVERMALLV